MIYLLDVSTLLALMWEIHEHNARAANWAKGKSLAVCPIGQLGFIRISNQRYGATISDATETLKEFCDGAQFIPDDLDLLPRAPNGAKTTDFYLADLAAKHDMKWATLDAKTNHPNAEVIL